MKYIKSKLSRQLFSLIIIIFGLVFISLGILLPRALLPVYENNLYNYLRQPLYLLEQDSDDSGLLNTEVAYIYLYENTSVISNNLSDIIDERNIDSLLNRMTERYGKFRYAGKNYYYYKMLNGSTTKIALTNDSYINQTRQEVLYTILPIVLMTFLIVSIILIAWSAFIVRRIEKLKTKIDHFDDDNFDHHVENQFDDEIRSLDFAIEDMRVSLKNQEEYRNQMYQNISHDFKTPLTVIKSYTEAVQDGVEDSNDALKVISEQTDKLEQKVHSLLYLNKLDYIKDYKNIQLDKIDIRPLIASSVTKFKFHRKDIAFHLVLDKNAKYDGTEDLWETIIDNMLNNFMRYAESEIKITTKKDKIVFYNDGPNIDEDLLEVIFVPFRKGMKGEFGLGLSIIKKTVNLLGYDISIKNLKKGVSFTLTKGIKK